MDLSSADKDRLYNFTCPGCRMRRNKRAAKMIGSSAPWAAGVKVMYCKSCAAEIADAGTTVEEIRNRPIDIEIIETRWKLDLQAVVREQARRPKG